jgi:hypothetical protein
MRLLDDVDRHIDCTTRRSTERGVLRGSRGAYVSTVVAAGVSVPAIVQAGADHCGQLSINERLVDS